MKRFFVIRPRKQATSLMKKYCRRISDILNRPEVVNEFVKDWHRINTEFLLYGGVRSEDLLDKYYRKAPKHD